MKRYLSTMQFYEIRLSVTGACNQKCFYCGPFVDGKHTRGYGHLSMGQLEELIDQLSKIINENNLHLQLTGGEPTLRKDLPEIVSLLHSRIKDIGLTTNGSLITPELTQRLIKNGLNDIHIHLASLDKEAYEKTCGIQVTDARIKNIIDSALMVQKMNRRVEFNTPVTGININSLDSLLDFCYSHKINLKLIEELRLDGSPEINIAQIKKLLDDWTKNRGIKVDETSIENRFGLIYEFGHDFFFRIAPVNEHFKNSLTNGAETILLDGRYWIGAHEGAYLFTPSYSIPPKEGTLEEIQTNLEFIISEYAKGRTDAI